MSPWHDDMGRRLCCGIASRTAILAGTTEQQDVDTIQLGISGTGVRSVCVGVWEWVRTAPVITFRSGSRLCFIAFLLPMDTVLARLLYQLQVVALATGSMTTRRNGTTCFKEMGPLHLGFTNWKC